METIVWILLPVGLGLGALWIFKHRGKRDSELKAKADKKASRARDDASAIQRTLDGRR
jgi:hypothetical protein